MADTNPVFTEAFDYLRERFEELSCAAWQVSDTAERLNLPEDVREALASLAAALSHVDSALTRLIEDAYFGSLPPAPRALAEQLFHHVLDHDTGAHIEARAVVLAMLRDKGECFGASVTPEIAKRCVDALFGEKTGQCNRTWFCDAI